MRIHLYYQTINIICELIRFIELTPIASPVPNRMRNSQTFASTSTNFICASVSPMCVHHQFAWPFFFTCLSTVLFFFKLFFYYFCLHFWIFRKKKLQRPALNGAGPEEALPGWCSLLRVPNGLETANRTRSEVEPKYDDAENWRSYGIHGETKNQNTGGGSARERKNSAETEKKDL